MFVVTTTYFIDFHLVLEAKKLTESLHSVADSVLHDSVKCSQKCLEEEESVHQHLEMQSRKLYLAALKIA